MKTKLIPAGKLKNLNDCKVGASVLIANGEVGTITDVTDVKTFNDGEIGQARLWINLPMRGSMMHVHRRDGRSHNDAEHDIVKVCLPENSKVKTIKIWSDQPLTTDLIEKGNELAVLAKCIIDTEKNGKNWTGMKKPLQHMEYGYIVKLGKSGLLSVKIWRV